MPWTVSADDPYTQQFAKLVKQRLRPDLQVYVEWGEFLSTHRPPHVEYVLRGRAGGWAGT